MANNKNYQSHLPCLACGAVSVDRTFHHIKTRGSGGSDEHWNLLSLDAIHHNEIHQIGLTAFAKKYPMIEEWLLRNGWEFDEFRKKWINARSALP